VSFDPIQVDVDGTLRNPVVAGSVLLWALILLTACVIFLKSGARFRAAAVAAILIGGWLMSPLVVSALVNGLYRITASSLSSVGLFGRSPAWVAPAVAGAGVLAMEVVARMRKRVA
jgi:hypothetical protein